MAHAEEHADPEKDPDESDEPEQAPVQADQEVAAEALRSHAARRRSGSVRSNRKLHGNEFFMVAAP